MNYDPSYIAIPLGIKLHHRNGLHISFSPSFHTFHMKVTALSNGITVFDADIPSNSRPTNFKTVQTFYVPWRVEITQAGQHVYVGDLNITGKEVCIDTLQGTLGEVAAWMPEIATFLNERNCNITVLMKREYLPLFVPVYEKIKFVDKSSFKEENYFAIYEMGVREDKDFNFAPSNPLMDNPMVYASKFLGVPVNMGEAPVIAPATEDCAAKYGKYICIAMTGAKKMNEWLCKGGWKKIVDDFTGRGYRVLRLDDSTACSTPEKAENMGGLTLQEKVNLLYGCESFIGVSGDYAWLAHCCERKVYLISGCTSAYSDVPTLRRFIDTGVCNGCASAGKANFKDYEGCPANCDYECSKAISAKDVLDTIHRDYIFPLVAPTTSKEKNANRKDTAIFCTAMQFNEAFFLQQVVNWYNRLSPLHDKADFFCTCDGALMNNLQVFDGKVEINQLSPFLGRASDSLCFGWRRSYAWTINYLRSRGYKHIIYMESDVAIVNLDKVLECLKKPGLFSARKTLNNTMETSFQIINDVSKVMPVAEHYAMEAGLKEDILTWKAFQNIPFELPLSAAQNVNGKQPETDIVTAVF